MPDSFLPEAPEDMGGPESPCEVAVLMPCLDEAETIPICIRKAQGYMESRGISGEVLITDNGSTDGFQAIAVSPGAHVAPHSFDVLVAPLDRAQDVRQVVDRLKLEGTDQHAPQVKVFRPWGSYQSIDAGHQFQVKQLTVKPGGCLSLQLLRHRVVVEGRARVTRGEEVFGLGPNQSTFIPLGNRHRLENPGQRPLRIIEIQCGDYLGEDEIERFDNIYGRTNE